MMARRSSTLRFVSLALLLILAAVAVVGCGSTTTTQAGATTTAAPAATTTSAAGQQSTSTTAQANTKAISIVVTLFVPETDMFAIPYKWWAEEVTKKTEGRVTFKSNWAGSLVSHTETLDAVRDGTVDMGLVGASAVSGTIPEFSVMELMGNYPLDVVERRAELYEEVNPLLTAVGERNGMEILFWGPAALQNFAVHSSKFLTKPEDFKGLKVRGAGRWQAAQINAMGGSAVSFDPSELYLALQNKTVDTTIQSAGLTFSGKLYEVVPKLAAYGLPQNSILYFMNKKVWDGIPEGDRKIILEISKEASLRTWTDIQAAEKVVLEKLPGLGAEVKFLTDQERQAFLDAWTPVFRDAEKAASVSEEGKKLVEVMKKYRGF